MTKVIILGKQPNGDLKPIEFIKYCAQKSWIDCADQPKDYKYIELIARDFSNSCDLMFAYNDGSIRGEGVLFLGFFNDGVV